MVGYHRRKKMGIIIYVNEEGEREKSKRRGGIRLRKAERNIKEFKNRFKFE